MSHLVFPLPNSRDKQVLCLISCTSPGTTPNYPHHSSILIYGRAGCLINNLRKPKVTVQCDGSCFDHPFRLPKSTAVRRLYIIIFLFRTLLRAHTCYMGCPSQISQTRVRVHSPDGSYAGPLASETNRKGRRAPKIQQPR